VIAFLADGLKIEPHDVFGTDINAKAAALAIGLVNGDTSHTVHPLRKEMLKG
jgi:hypothetical protein